MKSIDSFPIVSTLLIIVMVSIYFLDIYLYKGMLWEYGSGRSLEQLTITSFYRLFTYSFFHHSILHLVGNVCAIYFIGILIENKIGSWLFFIMYLISSVGSIVIYSLLFTYTNGNGASAGIYALIACLFLLILKDSYKITFGTWSTNYIILYFVLANFIGITGLLFHLIGFSIGVIITWILFI